MKRALTLLTAAVFMGACQDDISQQDHYKVPDWLKGNAYERLQGEENYSIFLKGVDLSGYQPIVDGQSIVTVMAPDNQAFEAFLKEKGYASIDDMFERDPDYLKRLITYHLMYFAFDWDKMVNFRPNEGDAATDQEKQLLSGTWYKHRTHSQRPMEYARATVEGRDTTVTIYHYESYLPVLSSELFRTKGIDAKYNYEYFYPGTAWGDNQANPKGCFNVANAAVLDKENVITDNGYLYHVNRVIDPMGTIYDQLADDPDYSDYLNLYNGYATFALAADETNQSLGFQAYVRRFTDLPNIALEWISENSLHFSDNEKFGYNVFAPSNAAIANFFTEYWKSGCGYASLQELDPLILRYFILQSFGADNFICFPEEIAKGKVLTIFGTPVNIDPDKVTKRVICENGAFYGMDHMQAPAIFSSIVGPAFNDTAYIDFLYTLDGSEQVLSLASQQTQFVSLIPSNKQFTENQPAIRLYTTTSGKQLQQYSDDAGDFAQMGSGAMRNIVNIHTAQNVGSLPTSGTKVIQTNAAFNFWFVKDGRITTNALFNQQLEPTFSGEVFVDFHPLTYDGRNWDNGSAYSYDNTGLFHPAEGDGLAHKLAVCNDKNYDYYMFAQLLSKAGLIDAKTNTLSLSILPDPESRFILFAPTNEAITNHLAEIPGCNKMTVNNGQISGSVSNKTDLANWLRQYFVNSMMNTITTYPYPGSDCRGKFYNVDNELITINTDGGKVSISGSAGSAEVSSRYDYLPFAFNDGCLQLLDDIMK